MRNTLLVFFSIFYIGITVAQIPVPAKDQNHSVLLMNGTAHIGNGEVIENAAIGFKKGKITYSGKALEVNKDEYEIIVDASGKHIYPGIIAPNSTLGLVEIGAVRATRDFNEVGAMNPNIRSVIAYNTESKITPTVRTNGVLMAQVTPRGGLITGTSSIVELDGWNWEDVVYKLDDGIHINWPNRFQKTGWWAAPGPVKENEKYSENISRLEELFSNASAYAANSESREKDLRWEAMRGLFDGSKAAFFRADFVRDIIDAVDFAKKHGVKKIVLVGGMDSWKVADLLKENNVSVILARIHRLPNLPEEDVDLPYRLPALLQEAGILFCLNNEGDMEAMGTRNLPFYAGTAAAYGLTKEQALMTITSNTAKILGIDKTAGTLETGKDATLFISTGDALDMRTNNVEQAYIRGKKLDLSNHQKALYEKYKAKYGIN